MRMLHESSGAIFELRPIRAQLENFQNGENEQ
jgi:hypothetical protein